MTRTNPGDNGGEITPSHQSHRPRERAAVRAPMTPALLQGKATRLVTFVVLDGPVNCPSPPGSASDEPPGRARTRWDVTDGGEVGYLDLGDALLLVPGGVEAFRRRVLGAVTEAVWAAAASGFGDPDLADE